MALAWLASSAKYGAAARARSRSASGPSSDIHVVSACAFRQAASDSSQLSISDRARCSPALRNAHRISCWPQRSGAVSRSAPGNADVSEECICVVVPAAGWLDQCEDASAVEPFVGVFMDGAWAVSLGHMAAAIDKTSLPAVVDRDVDRVGHHGARARRLGCTFLGSRASSMSSAGESLRRPAA